jgi:predicted metalloprotease with PDZ domain
VTRPGLHEWEADGHDGTVRMTYRIFGDRVDGTYLAIDATHAHLNMPATLLWARGYEARPAEVRFEVPAGSGWKAATQLFPTADPFTFTAPNLQYLMDSPTELSAFVLREFKVPGAAGEATIRVALHHDGTEIEADRYASDVETIVREAREVFGELPVFDGGTYTFIADYLPYASGDGMEHRNSTILTSSGSLASARQGLLGTVAHEFFHAWNVERIRPASLEPFDFTDANVSGELWLGEGFTSYYDALLMARTGLASLRETLGDFGAAAEAVILLPGRRLRSAVDMSRLAPFVDAANPVDRTNWDNTFISYYTYGAAIALGLDLTLRARSGGAVTLDHYMRALWARFGKPGGPAPGIVGTPYTLADARALLGEVAGDRAFAGDFFDRFIEGRDVVDYRSLLEHAGLVLRRRSPGRASAGTMRLAESAGRLRVAAPVPFGSPAYAAGLDRDDIVVSIDGAAVATVEGFRQELARRKPGDKVTVAFERRGRPVTAALALIEEERLEIVPIEETGGSLGPRARAFREAWLGGRRMKEEG